MKRFWTDVKVTQASDGYGIALDARPVKTPARNDLLLPTTALAEAVAQEWRDQEGDIVPASMPFTGLANAAIDIVRVDPTSFAAQLSTYAESELLCYRAPEADLAAEQVRVWNPLLDWAEGQYHVVFTLTHGIMPVEQPADTLAKLAAATATLPAFSLAGLSPLVTIGGSLVAALAVEANAMLPDTAWDAVTLDEMWQEQRWGVDDDAVAVRLRRKSEWDSAARFLNLLD